MPLVVELPLIARTSPWQDISTAPVDDIEAGESRPVETLGTEKTHLAVELCRDSGLPQGAGTTASEWSARLSEAHTASLTKR